MNKPELIKKVLGEFYRPAPPYHSELPSELAEWHCYTADGGHSILVVLESAEVADPVKSLCPCPVKAVLRSKWRRIGEFVYADLPYDPDLGLITEPTDDEY